MTSIITTYFFIENVYEIPVQHKVSRGAYKSATETSRNITARVIERDTSGEIYYFLEDSRGFSGSLAKVGPCANKIHNHHHHHPGGSELANMVANDNKIVAKLVSKKDANLALPPRFRQVLIESPLLQVGTHRRKFRLCRGRNYNFNYITCEEVKSVESTFSLDTSYVRATREPEKKGRTFPNFYKMYKNALKEDFIRVVEKLDGTVESTDTIVKLKTKIENSSTFESDPDFVKTLIQNCIDERVSRNKREVTSGKQKIELAKLQLAQLEKEVELQRVKNKALSLNPAAKFEEKQFKTLNKETATHIGIREAEDWFRPIDLAKECDIYISSRSGSHKEIPITYGYTQDPFKNRSQNFKPKIKENYPQYHERENKNCYICGDSSHCARDCEKRFKPKESNDHIHNKINVNTLKIESEKQNSDEGANLQYVNIFVENQPVTALIDSGCQIPVLNSSLIRVQTPSEEIITLSSCFGEKRMVEVKPINISLNQHSTSLSVRTAISPTLTEEFIIHPSVYSEIEKLGHAKSDVLLSESGSSLGADLSVDYGVSFPNVSVSNVIENSSYDLPYVKNFNTRNDSSSLIKDYKCNKIKSTKLKLSIVREKCSDIVLCKKANGAMKTSSVEFISRSPNPLPMKSKHHRFVLLRKNFVPWQWKRRKKRNRFEQTSRTLQRKISMRSTKDQLVEKDVLIPVKQCFPVEPSGCRRGAFT
ncbi:phosphatase and actin regulator 2 [Trichonephila clavipes]|nr:phosphatase and actin regulator 2 [Trichonephila clavipes]